MNDNKIVPDGGLQPERTSLSWSRTFFVLLLDTLLLVKIGYSNQYYFVLYPGLILFVLTILFFLSEVFRSTKLSLKKGVNFSKDIWIKKILTILLFFSSLLISISYFVYIISNCYLF